MGQYMGSNKDEPEKDTQRKKELEGAGGDIHFTSALEFETSLKSADSSPDVFKEEEWEEEEEEEEGEKWEVDMTRLATQYNGMKVNLVSKECDSGLQIKPSPSALSNTGPRVDTPTPCSDSRESPSPPPVCSMPPHLIPQISKHSPTCVSASRGGAASGSGIDRQLVSSMEPQTVQAFPSPGAENLLPPVKCVDCERELSAEEAQQRKDEGEAPLCDTCRSAHLSFLQDDSNGKGVVDQASADTRSSPDVVPEGPMCKLPGCPKQADVKSKKYYEFCSKGHYQMYDMMTPSPVSLKPTTSQRSPTSPTGPSHSGGGEGSSCQYPGCSEVCGVEGTGRVLGCCEVHQKGEERQLSEFQECSGGQGGDGGGQEGDGGGQRGDGGDQKDDCGQGGDGGGQRSHHSTLGHGGGSHGHDRSSRGGGGGHTPQHHPPASTPRRKTCRSPGCERPCYVEQYGRVHDFFGWTHAQQYQSEQTRSGRTAWSQYKDEESQEVLGWMAEKIGAFWGPGPSSHTNSGSHDNTGNHEKRSSGQRGSSAIKFYNKHEPYYEFTNFYQAPLHIDGKVWATSENYFQAQKYIGTPLYDAIQQSQTARAAFDVSCTPGLGLQWRRCDWEEVKEDVMYIALYAKFTQHEGLMKMLLDTGDCKLVKHTSQDSYWGDGGDGSGQNKLGKLLMRLREELRKEMETVAGPISQGGRNWRNEGVGQSRAKKGSVDASDIESSVD